MNNKLFRSLLVIVSFLTLACVTTYAVFTAAPVTVANNTITTGSANAAICDAAIGSGKHSINSSFVVSNLIPGEENERELTEGKEIFIGNDGGNLQSSGGACPSYEGTPGSSDISMRFVPKVIFISCSEESKDDIGLDFDLGEGLRTGYKSLKQWSTNTELLGPVYLKNDAKRINMYAALDIQSELQSTTCQFDVIFHGQQADEEI